EVQRAVAAATRLYLERAPDRAGALAQALAAHLRAARWSERAAAARALGAHAGAAAAAVTQLASAQSDPDGFVRVAATDALATAPGPTRCLWSPLFYDRAAMNDAQQVRVCPKCGTASPLEYRFCGLCGHKLDEVAPTAGRTQYFSALQASVDARLVL